MNPLHHNAHKKTFRNLVLLRTKSLEKHYTYVWAKGIHIRSCLKAKCNPNHCIYLNPRKHFLPKAALCVCMVYLVYYSLQSWEESGVEVPQQVHDPTASPQRGWSSDWNRLPSSSSTGLGWRSGNRGRRGRRDSCGWVWRKPKMANYSHFLFLTSSMAIAEVYTYIDPLRTYITKTFDGNIFGKFEYSWNFLHVMPPSDHKYRNFLLSY